MNFAEACGDIDKAFWRVSFSRAGQRLLKESGGDDYMKRFVKFGVLSAAMFLVCVSFATGLHAGAVAGAGGDDPWSPADLMQPEDLAKLLSTQHKPVVLQVGIVHLYK